MSRIKGYPPRVLAFLDMIAFSEIGQPMLDDPATDDGYKVIVGSRPGKLILLENYAHHPQVLITELNSTAAGRYQIIRGTWFGVAGELGLTDFGPENQDRAAIHLIDQRGALPAVQDGDLAKAISYCGLEWASLAGSPYGQTTNSLSSLQTAYNAALAAIGAA